MAPFTAHKATQRLLVYSYGNWAKGSNLALLPPEHQSQRVLPFFWKPIRQFSLLQHGMTTSKPKTLCAHNLVLRSNLQINNSVKSVLETVNIGSRHLWAKCGCADLGEQWRRFSVTAPAANQLGMGKGETGPEPDREDDWALRLANENGFLSWCRNCYLTTVVAIAIMAEGATPLALQAAEGAFFVSGLNLMWGTYQYVYNLFRLRSRTGMSAVGSLMYMSMALLHLALWFVVCTTFLGYGEEPDSKAPGQETSGAKQGEDV